MEKLVFLFGSAVKDFNWSSRLCYIIYRPQMTDYGLSSNGIVLLFTPTVCTVTESSLLRVRFQRKAGFFSTTTYSYVLYSKCKVLPVSSNGIVTMMQRKSVILLKKSCNKCIINKKCFYI